MCVYGHWVVIAWDSDRGSFPPEIPLHSGIILCALSALGSSQGCIYISLFFAYQECAWNWWDFSQVFILT